MTLAPAVFSAAEEQAAFAAAVESLRGLRDQWKATADAGDRAKLVNEAAGNLAMLKLVDPVQADFYLAEVAGVTGVTKGSLRGMVGRASSFYKTTAAAAKSPCKSAPSNTDAMLNACADPRPKIRLPGEGRLHSDVATELASYLIGAGIYLWNGEVVAVDGDRLRTVDTQYFRTLAEKFVVFYRQRRSQDQVYQVNVTMREDDARCILAAPQFSERLLKLCRVNHARLPVIRADGRLELLPDGYDFDRQTLTLLGVEYSLDMELAEAVAIITDLLAEFCFADGERSKAVAVAAMLGLYAAQLIPEKSLRPCFIFAANAEGAGKTLLVQVIVAPTLGELPTGCKADAEDELRKVILTAVREGRAVIFLDNLKGRLSSEALEAFLSAPVWSDRKLGVNETITADNLATVFITGNGLTVSPDMRRRSLFVELHLEVERAEDRQFKRNLDLPTLLTMRPRILTAFWSLVKHWDAQGRPSPSRSHSAFPSWSNIVAGIVEAAGFACPLDTANVAAAADADADDVRLLVAGMDGNTALNFPELVALARSLGCFEAIIGTDETELDRKAKAILARLLTRYDRRLVGHHRFVIEGKGHARKYRVTTTTPQHGDMVEHGVSAKLRKEDIREPDGNTMRDHATMQPHQPEPEATTSDTLRL